MLYIQRTDLDYAINSAIALYNAIAECLPSDLAERKRIYNQIAKTINYNASNLQNEIVQKIQWVTNADIRQYLQENILKKINRLSLEYLIFGSTYILKNSSILKDIVRMHFTFMELYGNYLESIVSKYVEKHAQNLRYNDITDTLLGGKYTLYDHLALWVEKYSTGETVDEQDKFHSSIIDSVEGDYSLDVIEATEFDGSELVESELFTSQAYYVKAMSLISDADKLLFTDASNGRSATKNQHSSIMNYLAKQDYDDLATQLTCIDNKDLGFSVCGSVFTKPETISRTSGHATTKLNLVTDGLNVVTSLQNLITMHLAYYDLHKEYPVFCAKIYKEFLEHRPRVTKSSTQNSVFSDMENTMSFTTVLNGLLAANSIKNTLLKNGYTLVTFPCIALRNNTWKHKSNLKELVKYYKVDQNILGGVLASEGSPEIILRGEPISVKEIYSTTEEPVLASQDLIPQEMLESLLNGCESFKQIFKSNIQNKRVRQKSSIATEAIDMLRSGLINLNQIELSPSSQNRLLGEGYEQPYLSIRIIEDLMSDPDRFTDFHTNLKMCELLIDFILTIYNGTNPNFDIAKRSFLVSINTNNIEAAHATLTQELNKLGLQEKYVELFNTLSITLENKEVLLKTCDQIFDELFKDLSLYTNRYDTVQNFEYLVGPSTNCMRIYTNIKFLYELTIIKQNLIRLFSALLNQLESGQSVYNVFIGRNAKTPALALSIIRCLNKYSLSEYYLNNFTYHLSEKFKQSKKAKAIFMPEVDAIWTLSEKLYEHISSQVRMLVEFVDVKCFTDIKILLTDGDVSTREKAVYDRAISEFIACYSSDIGVVPNQIREELASFKTLDTSDILLRDVKGVPIAVTVGEDTILYSTCGFKYLVEKGTVKIMDIQDIKILNSKDSEF